MDINQIAGLSRQELMDCISEKKKEIAKKVQNGETEPKFSIGADSYTVKEWDKLISKVDKNNEEVRKEQEQRKETQEKEDLEEKKIGNTQFVSILEVNDVRRNYFMEKINGTYKPSFPYASYADGNTINYNGVTVRRMRSVSVICLTEAMYSRSL